MSLLKTTSRNRSLVKKRSIDLSGFKKYWELREHGSSVTDDGKLIGREKKVFRCMQCGATTGCKGDYNGEPDISKCTSECQAHTKATRAARHVVTNKYSREYVRIFGHD